MKRYVIEYAADQAREYKRLYKEYKSPQAQKAVEKIEKAVDLCKRGYITHNEAIAMINRPI